MQSFIPKSHRSVLAKLRCGVLPLRIESGRFVNLPKESRIYELCTLDEVENEKHSFATVLHLVKEENNCMMTLSVLPQFFSPNMSEPEKFKDIVKTGNPCCSDEMNPCVFICYGTLAKYF